MIIMQESSYMVSEQWYYESSLKNLNLILKIKFDVYTSMNPITKNP